ncbi:MAG: hypothetical protein LUD82_01125 [Clostridiales bacterium]|nr:hypothetical protein [Clostridiales bacterium]
MVMASDATLSSFDFYAAAGQPWSDAGQSARVNDHNRVRVMTHLLHKAK